LALPLHPSAKSFHHPCLIKEKILMLANVRFISLPFSLPSISVAGGMFKQKTQTTDCVRVRHSCRVPLVFASEPKLPSTSNFLLISHPRIGMEKFLASFISLRPHLGRCGRMKNLEQSFSTYDSITTPTNELVRLEKKALMSIY